MKDILDLQKRNFIENGHPSLEQRLDRLKRCVALIETHDDQIIESLKSEDQIAVQNLNLDSQIIEKINKFAPIKYILKNNSEDEQKIIELLEDI